MTNKRVQGGARDLITVVASDLFARFGFDKVSTRDIATAAHIRQASIYYHFPTKQEIYDHVIEIAAGSVMKLIEEATSKVSDPRLKIFALFRALIVEINSDATTTRLLDREFLREGGLGNQNARQQLSRIGDMLTDIVRLISPSCDAERIAFSFSSLAQGARRPIVQRQFENLIRKEGLGAMSDWLAQWALDAAFPLSNNVVRHRAMSEVADENRRLRDLVVDLSLRLASQPGRAQVIKASVKKKPPQRK